MNKTPYDLGMETSLRDVAIALLESKYRSVPVHVIERIGKFTYAELRTLIIGIPGATSIEELFPTT